MAELASNNRTLLDLAKVKDPDGTPAAVVEVLNQTNEIIQDMVFRPSNKDTSNVTTIRTGIPEPTWVKLYQHIQPTKSTTAQVEDTCGMMRNFSEIDAALADLEGNTAAFQMIEDRPIIEGFGQELANTLFYGNVRTEPEAFMGLGPRFNSLSAANGENIINGGGSGSDNGSIWLVVWGDSTVFGIVPKNSVAGIQVMPLGKQIKENTNGLLPVYRTQYEWHAGLVVKDWRAVVRIANIDKSALTKDLTGSSADLADLMFQAMETVQGLNMGRPAFYMSRSMRSMLRRQAAHSIADATLTVENIGGVPVSFFHGIPLRQCDALAADEAAVS